MSIELVEMDKMYANYIPEIKEIRNECAKSLKDSREISEADVYSFFLDKVFSGEQKIFIIKHTEGVIGYMNIKYFDNNKCEVGIKIKEKHRNKKLGKKSLEMLINKLLDESMDEISAEIKSDNEPSQKLFASLGFKKISDKEGVEVWQLKRE